MTGFSPVTTTKKVRQTFHQFTINPHIFFHLYKKSSNAMKMKGTERQTDRQTDKRTNRFLMGEKYSCGSVTYL